MRISASAPRGGDVRDHIRRLSLTAECDADQEFVTAVYRIACYDDIKAREKGIKWMRDFLGVEPAPRSRSKKQKIEDELRRSDLTAQLTGRDDIEWGHHDSLPRGEHVANPRK